MGSVGEHKGQLLVSIQPDEKDVKVFRIVKIIFPIISAVVVVVTFAIILMLFGTDIPLDMLFFLVLLVPMSIFADLFSIAIATPFASPVDVYSNGVEFRSSKFGAKMRMVGFLPKDQIESVELHLAHTRRQGKGVYIWLKNKRVQVIRRKDDDDLIRVARTLEEALRIKVERK